MDWPLQGYSHRVERSTYCVAGRFEQCVPSLQRAEARKMALCDRRLLPHRRRFGAGAWKCRAGGKVRRICFEKREENLEAESSSIRSRNESNPPFRPRRERNWLVLLERRKLPVTGGCAKERLLLARGSARTWKMNSRCVHL